LLNGTSKLGVRRSRKWKAEVAARKDKHNKEDKARKSKSPQDKSRNPWEKVLSNVEAKESATSGTKDITRMRQVILGRKTDIKK
jgi:hypothetical protein